MRSRISAGKGISGLRKIFNKIKCLLGFHKYYLFYKAIGSIDPLDHIYSCENCNDTWSSFTMHIKTTRESWGLVTTKDNPIDGYLTL